MAGGFCGEGRGRRRKIKFFFFHPFLICPPRTQATPRFKSDCLQLPIFLWPPQLNATFADASPHDAPPSAKPMKTVLSKKPIRPDRIGKFMWDTHRRWCDDGYLSRWRVTLIGRRIAPAVWVHGPRASFCTTNVSGLTRIDGRIMPETDGTLLRIVRLRRVSVIRKFKNVLQFFIKIFIPFLPNCWTGLTGSAAVSNEILRGFWGQTIFQPYELLSIYVSILLWRIAILWISSSLAH